MKVIAEALREKYGSAAAAARVVGIPESTMQAMAGGRRVNPRLETLVQIARGLNVSLTELILYMETGEGPLSKAYAPAVKNSDVRGKVLTVA